MASRFVEADEQFIEEVKQGSKATKWSTDYWTGIFLPVGENKRRNEELESYEVPRLNEALLYFFAELRKGNGKEYEPDSPRVMQASLDRYFKRKNYPKSIVRDTEFLSSRQVLEGNARKLREFGNGKTAKQSPKPD